MAVEPPSGVKTLGLPFVLTIPVLATAAIGIRLELSFFLQYLPPATLRPPTLWLQPPPFTVALPPTSISVPPPRGVSAPAQRAQEGALHLFRGPFAVFFFTPTGVGWFGAKPPAVPTS